jgi:2-desacetyl-2-hydroxyethyl bacteriochlorophyllide A dehydrogenase
MKTLVCTQPGTFEYQEREKPVLTKGGAILKIKRIGICGTDLHAYEGTQPFFNYPRILGHELCAELIDSDGSGFYQGETVAVIPYFNCGTCVACRNKKPNCCVHINVCGVHSDGGFAEYLSVPAYALVRGEGLSPESLALVEPLAIGAHAIRIANIHAGEFVVVIGAGPIGLGIMEFARLAGANVIAVDVNDERLKFCMQVINVQYSINPTTSNMMEQLTEITHGDMPAVVIDASGNRNAINNGFQYLAHGGKYVLVGLQKETINFSHPEFHKREGTLMSSRNATRQDFEHVITAIKNKKIDPSKYITHTVNFHGVKDVFSEWRKPASNVIKAIVELD